MPAASGSLTSSAQVTGKVCFFAPDFHHSDYKAMKPYIDIVDSIKANSMAKFDGLI